MCERDYEELIDEVDEMNEEQNKEVYSDGESDIEEITDLDPQEEDLTPAVKTDYTMNKIKCFPRPIAVHFLENNSPDMNMHFLIRQQIATEGK